MTHDYLVRRAVQWLRSQRHPLVFSEMASCNEIPDAIGFSRRATVVVECKTSRSDFLCDRAKYMRLEHPLGGYLSLKAPLVQRQMYEQQGAVVKPIPSMGTQRYYLCEPGLLTIEDVERRHPDHGLLQLHGKVVKKLREAPMREPSTRDVHAEQEFLQFALRHVLQNCATAGVRIDLIRASKMFNHGAIDLAGWKKQQERLKQNDPTGSAADYAALPDKENRGELSVDRTDAQPVPHQHTIAPGAFSGTAGA